MKVLELKGYDSLRALNAYSTLLLGIKMLPAYAAIGYEEFLAIVNHMSGAEQEKIFREAAMFVPLEKAEVEALVCFCTDKNGVPYGAAQLKNLDPEVLVDIIVAVCLEIAKIKIDLVSENEKKN